ncbi:MAG: hypothetical protein PHU27_13285 [Salinivirgaceae bacterium]|nr:hypothetical protein [Salinivirgaceae bacterium]
MFGVIGIVIAVAVVGAIGVKFYLASKENRVIQFAQEYLDQKYEQEMLYKKIRYSWVDPGLYHVTFFPANNQDLFFEVKVWPQVLDFSKGTTDYDGYVGDNYISRIFCVKTAEKIRSEVKMIWDEDVDIYVTLNTNNVYPRRGVEEPNEQMTAEEMEPLYNYEVFIVTNRLLNDESKFEEAKRIFDMIQYVQISQYNPREILFLYQTGKKDKGKSIEGHIWFGDGIDPYHLGRFENWFEIASIEEVIKAMDEQWFNE